MTILEGFETVNDVDVRRISTVVTGTISGTGNQGGMDLTFAGTSKGEERLVLRGQRGHLRQGEFRIDDADVYRRARRGHDHPATQTSKGEIKLTGKA